MGCFVSSVIYYIIATFLAVDPRLEPISGTQRGNDDRIYLYGLVWALSTKKTRTVLVFSFC